MNCSKELTDEPVSLQEPDPQGGVPQEGNPFKPATDGTIRPLVAAHIELVTRFDGKHLEDAGPEEGFAVSLELALTQEVSFAISRSEGPGYLSSSTEKLRNPADFNSELDERLEKAEDNVTIAVKAWLAKDPQSYRRLLPPSAAFLTSPGRVGYEHQCGGCHGACKVTCSHCNGIGNTQCHYCFGNGKVNCTQCHGQKTTACSSCSGRGSWTEYIPEQRWDSSTNGYVHSTRTEFRTCHSCSGSGKKTCHACDWQGKVQCTSCWGNGHINCIPCTATGKVSCRACNATGVQHVSGTVVASVAKDEMLTIVSEDKILESLIRQKIAIEDLPTYGALLGVQHDFVGSYLESRHRLRIDVRRARIRASEREFVLYGFGPAPVVFDFQNIAGHMLEVDLAALEQQLASASRWYLHANGGLLDATADFLQSELNMLIAEKVADAKAAPAEAAAQVQDHFRGLVESSYVERATTALRGALSRVYGAELTKPAAYLAGLAALAAGGMFALSWPVENLALIGLTSIGGSMVIWLILEWATRRRIARRFEPDFARRVIAQLAANGSIKRWRIGMGIGAIVAAALSIQVTQEVPYVRDMHREKREMAEAPRILEQWFFQSSPDWTQRTYPSRRMLETQGEAGVWRAQMILAWQFLLGAGGAAKDTEKAGYWLDKAEAETYKSAAWKAAKAILSLQKEPSPEALKAASQALKQAADTADFIEARYWEGRTYLDVRSPVYDLKRGIKVMKQAADRNHAHAALMLGQLLSSKESAQRNIPVARRYLQRAADAGLTEATVVLATLQ